MAEFTLSEVLAATDGRLLHEYSTSFNGVSTDTRTLKAGNLFVALQGDNFDAHDYLVRAMDSGALGVIISKQEAYVPEKLTVILVEDTLVAFQALAKLHRQRFALPLIGITGSNGKTTTKDMTAAVLSVKYQVLKTEANFNNDIGLALTLLKLNEQHQVGVLEMGMRGVGEIKRLAGVALPTIGVITNVGETHIELLGSVENIGAAKAELVAEIGDQGLVVLNYDLPLVRDMANVAIGKVVFYGLEVGADVQAVNIVSEGTRTFFDCISSAGTFRVGLEAMGQHNVYNALAAITVGLELGLSPAEVCSGLEQFVPGAMRLQILSIGEYVIINDAYNASPLSMRAAIDTLGTAARGRKVTVLGDMLELGIFAMEAHRRIGRQLAQVGVQVVITVGEMAKHIAAAALECGVAVTVACATHEEAQEALHKLIRPGDTILVKGSRGMKMETIIEMFPQ
jgi:UDP-N-acetylmuramoyl-tripeptide--D-alanyl-D-alanine ligase